MKHFVALIVISIGFISMATSHALALPGTGDELENIKEHMEDPSFGEAINPDDLKGYYIGACYQSVRVSTEALFFNKFVNAKGSAENLGISTLQVYDGYELPSHLSFLLQPGQRGVSFIEKLVKDGLSGTDNNIGKVSAGVDFKNLYSSNLNANTFTVSVKPYRGCSGNVVCNPPVLQACKYGYNAGHLTYDECVRNNDQTVFKKEHDSTLISHRTAQGLGRPTNNLSFYLAPISTYCRWVKTPGVVAVKNLREDKQNCHRCGSQGYPGCEICE